MNFIVILVVLDILKFDTSISSNYKNSPTYIIPCQAN